MEALIGLPYAVASLAMAPFLIGLAVLLWKRPKPAALRPQVVIPTVAFTTFLAALFFLYPRPENATHEVSMVFTDTRGQRISDITLEVEYSYHDFDLLQGGTRRHSETRLTPTGQFTLTKTKGEEAEIKVQKSGYYLTSITVPNVWPASRDHGLQRIKIIWQKDWSALRWDVDACTATMNWPLQSSPPFPVIMLDWSAPAVSPLPKYTKEDFRKFEESMK